jgi:uncharacterized protein YecE (DUF72 family)
MLYIGCRSFCMARQRYYLAFNAVEIQDTFYNPPEKLRSLASKAPQSFVFSMKAWQATSHPLDSPTWKKAEVVSDKRLADRYGFLRPTKEVFGGCRTPANHCGEPSARNSATQQCIERFAWACPGLCALL